MNDADRALPELVTTYLVAIHDLAEATLSVLAHDTEENRQRAWHLAHKCLGHEWWEGVRIEGVERQQGGS